MSDLIVGAALVLVIEGLLWGLAPHLAMRLLAVAAATPERSLRSAGWIAVAVGVAIVWLIRG
jgi:uncharacterized protein YjeT (DUF2065 family)